MIDTNTLFQQITPTAAKSGGSTGAWIFLLIFFGIIIALIIVATVGARKDRMEKLVENDKRKKLKTEATTNRIALYATLYDLVTGLEKELEDFKPSVGTKSLGDINKETSSLIKKISKSKQLSKIYLSDDFKTEIKPMVDELSKVKPSNWNKEASFAVGLVKAKFEALSKDKTNADDIKKGRTLEWN